MISDATYQRGRRRRQESPEGAVAARLGVDPRTVRELAKRLERDLRWLDIATGPDVVNGTPASYEACLAMGLDPISGVSISDTSEAA
jgi:hypothetical protein